jgi:hypothetical protein
MGGDRSPYRTRNPDPEVRPPAEDELATHVIELAIYWHGELLCVRYAPPAHGLSLSAFGVRDLPGFDTHAALSIPGSVDETAETHALALLIRLTRRFAARGASRQGIEPRGAAAIVVAALVHALAFAVVAWLGQAYGDPRAVGVTVEDLDAMRSYLASSDEGSHAPAEGPHAGHGPEDDVPGGTGAAADGDERVIGRAHPIETASRYELADRDQAASVEEARTFGMIGLLAGQPADGQRVDWGPGPRDVIGAMWGQSTGEAEGFYGLGLSGVGAGGGDRGVGVGLGAVGTIGRGRGLGLGEDSGPGAGGGTCDDGCAAGGLGRGRGSGALRSHHVAIIRCRLSEEPSVSGRLPPETIQRVVRQSFGRFRSCYQQGLARDPSLAGRVSTKFVIARDGSVGVAVDAGSDLADAGVASCVRHEFAGLSFPEPPGGAVSVVYPISFSPE